MKKKKKSIFSKENNTAFHGENGQKFLIGVLIIIAFSIFVAICAFIANPTYFYSLIY